MSVDLLKDEAAMRLDQAVDVLGALEAQITISTNPIVLKMNQRGRGLKPPTDEKAVYWVHGNRVTADDSVIDHNYEFIVDIRGDVYAAEKLLKEITLTLTALPEGFQVPGLPESLREHEHFDFRTVLRAIVTTAKDGLLGQSVSLAFRAGGLSVVPSLREYLRRVARQVADYQEFVPDTLPMNERYVEKSENECVVDGVVMALRYAKALFFARDYIPPPVEKFKYWDRLEPYKRLSVLSAYEAPLPIKTLQDQQIEPPYFFVDCATFHEQNNGNSLETLLRYFRKAEEQLKDRTEPKNTVSESFNNDTGNTTNSRRSLHESTIAKILEYFAERAQEGDAMYLDPDPTIVEQLEQYGLEYPTDLESCNDTLTRLKNLA